MTNFITKEGFAKLQSRLNYLKNTKRAEIGKQLEKALTTAGNTEENTELELARQEQAMIEKEISDLENSLENAQVITKKEGSMKAVKIGSVVKVKSGDGKWVFRIVGTMEANPKEGKISHASPIGQALLNRQPGDKVMVELPDGVMEYKICAVG